MAVITTSSNTPRCSSDPNVHTIFFGTARTNKYAMRAPRDLSHSTKRFSEITCCIDTLEINGRHVLMRDAFAHPYPTRPALAEDVEVVPKDLDTGCKFSQLVLHGQLQEVEGMLRASSAEASVELIEGTGYAFPALILAALASPVEMSQLLIDNGAKLDSRSRCAAEEQIPLGSTALHCAASQGRLEIVLALLEAGAWPNISDSQGVTPMMLVTRFEDPANHVAMTRALLDAGADPFSADVRGTMAFHVAAGRGSIEVVDMLLAKAPSTLNQTTANGATAL